MDRPLTGLSTWRKLKSLIGVTSGGAIIFTGISLYQGDEKFYKNVAMPLVRTVDPEVAHRIAVIAAKIGIGASQNDSPVLRTSLWGLDFQNPLGMAAGFDKHAEAVKGLHKMGFGFVEIGSVTPKPQLGNPKPRVFRLQEDKAIINRYGFNSEGHEVVHSRLLAVRESKDFRGIIGVNLGKNKLSEDPVKDYVDGIVKFSDVADYYVVNVSSPNTPGLRSMQGKRELEELLGEVNQARSRTERRPPLLLKIAPDLSDAELRDIADVVRKRDTSVDGIIVSNTTLSRDNLTDSLKDEAGGLSGAPVCSLSTKIIARMYQYTKGQIPIVGVGGIFGGEDAYVKIKAGASLVQIYTAFAYHGPPIVVKIKNELANLLEKDGYKSVADAVGKESKNYLPVKA